MRKAIGLGVLAALALAAFSAGASADQTLKKTLSVTVVPPAPTVCDICGGSGGCGPGNMRSTNGYTTLNTLTNNGAIVTAVQNYCGDGLSGAYACNAPWDTVKSGQNGGAVTFGRTTTVGYYYYTGTCATAGGSIPSSSVFRNTYHCFPAGTLILMCDGSYQKIENVTSGECVQSYDTDQQRFVQTTVSATTQDETDKYYVINTSAGTLKVTPAHEIYVDGKWEDSNDIKPGDTLVGEDGKPVKVESVETVNQTIPVYDLVTGDPHDFFADHVLVHNVNQGASMKDHGFGAGAMVALADGSLVPVERIKAGDKVMSYDYARKRYAYNTVKIARKQLVSRFRLINGKLKMGMRQPIFIAKKTKAAKGK